LKAVETVRLTRTFKRGKETIKALDDVSIEVKRGEIFGLLGPNGAGKTTLVKILTTLLLPSSGEAYVMGYDVVKEPKKVKAIINLVSGGETPGYGILTVRENLWFFSQLYGIGREEANKRIDIIIEELGLNGYEDTLMSQLSSGYKQRLNVARGFINDPEILFLDEPTLGLDVVSAKDLRRKIYEWVKKEDKTAFLTTHYMHEADELCDRVALINKGRIIALDMPVNLKKRLKSKASFEIELVGFIEDLSWIRSVKGVEGFNRKDFEDFFMLKVVMGGEEYLPDLLSALSSKGLKVKRLNKVEPTLEDVYIHMIKDD
jgi:ABC-2 type transport system ATP-binding protein